MNLGAAWSALFTKAETSVADEIKHRDWTSLRWIALVAFVGLIIFNATRQIVSPEGLQLIFRAFVVWTIGNTLTRLAVIAANAWTKVAQIQTLPAPATPIVSTAPSAPGVAPLK